MGNGGTPVFVVSRTAYGWAVFEAGKQVGLFQTQGHALKDVKRRRADLSAQGIRSSIEVKGSPDR